MHQKAPDDLIARLSSQFHTAVQEAPERLSSLLPILKKLHLQFKKESLPEKATFILHLRDAVTKGIQDPGDTRCMQEIEAFINRLRGSGTEKDHPENAAMATLPEDMEAFSEIEDKLHLLGQMIAGFCPQSSPDKNGIIQAVSAIEEASRNLSEKTFHDICVACKQYTARMGLNTAHDIRPIEETLLVFKSILSHMKRGEPFTFDYSDVLEHLDYQYTAGPAPEPEDPSLLNEKVTGPRPLSEDDLDIMADFVSEAFDNLEAIEVRLVDLEADPHNTDIINEIFRPIHTIKGVSGFLSLEKINSLAHAAENLLDKARNGDLIITEQAIDAILASVDVLKQIVERLDQGVTQGVKLPDDDIDIACVKAVLQDIQISRSKGGPRPIGELLLEQKVLDRPGLDHALEIQQQQPDRKLGQILVEENKIAPQKVASALMSQGRARPQTTAQVKVDTRKLDDLVDYAGELVIAQSILKQKTGSDPSLSQSISQLGLIVTNMQNIAMSMRMIPIKATFMKMIRLVRDLSRKTGKTVNLNMGGEDTEIDRNVVEALYEPMVHMIRNSVDHGLESEAERVACGKPAQGQIYLRAYHKGGSIVIEIEDDGRGLDRERIREKALAKGMIQETDKMSDSQVFDLIMLPGFSTAKQITDVSGRGVGMDVVKAGIEKFRGHLTISSRPLKGTKFTISLPLTLAIIDGMLVRADKEKYVIPTTAIQRAFKPGRDEYFTVEGKGELVKDRGNLLPLIRLNDIFGTATADKDIHNSLVVVVESKETQRALLIDELLGKGEYVIKSLGTNLEHVTGIAGGAILGDGKVGLILDIHGIFSSAA